MFARHPSFATALAAFVATSVAILAHAAAAGSAPFA
jgi:hypothetical protein